MPKLERPLRRICVRIFAEDDAFIDEMAKMDPRGEISKNLIIRSMIHAMVTQTRAKERAKLDKIKATPKVEIDLEDLEHEEDPCPID